LRPTCWRTPTGLRETRSAGQGTAEGMVSMAAVKHEGVVKLPNADETFSLGTNDTDVIGWLMASHDLNEHWRL
jgi:hypothetical protein